jgi:hypothetical protein
VLAMDEKSAATSRIVKTSWCSMEEEKE